MARGIVTAGDAIKNTVDGADTSSLWAEFQETMRLRNAGAGQPHGFRVVPHDRRWREGRADHGRGRLRGGVRVRCSGRVFGPVTTF
jgi:hypothetical protein